MSVLINVPSEISQVKSMADGTIRVQVDTQELDSEAVARIFDFRNKMLYVSFQETQVEKLPEAPPLVKSEKKSLSRKLRDTLYVYWENNLSKINYPDFEKFYEKQMLQYIETIQNELPK